MPLNLFYEEPDPDRWLPLDRFPRQAIRRLLRGPAKIGGQKRVFLNLCAGLDRLGVPYRINNYRHIRRHPEEVACILGKTQLLDKIRWQNPILLGPAILSHPCDRPDLMQRLPIEKIVVPGEWMRQMCEPAFGDRVLAWPVGIDTEQWRPVPDSLKDIDILLYDKVRWQRGHYGPELIQPIQALLAQRGLKVAVLRYGAYQEAEFHHLLRRSRAMIFLCEHETQGIAYQQALACNVPILAWDRGGFWQDPSYYPSKVQYGPVSSVPYWDDRCGLKFASLNEFPAQLDAFLAGLSQRQFCPREYILENLTLECCARQYLDIVQSIQAHFAIQPITPPPQLSQFPYPA
ncbi:glycosyltransferase [Leptolyngbya sp. 'hensonii']|nr:glycosyltransferase [Leptolyngbya sp. 'hensonii']